MRVTLRFPGNGDRTTSVEELLRRVREDPTDGRLQAGDERMVEFLADLARGLLTAPVSRRSPELGSLGFFLRPAELRAAARRLTSADTDAIRVPRGLAIHFPPANVDTTFVYSWALSALAGNCNVVRLSQRSGAAADVILEQLAGALSRAHPAIAETQKIVSYEHDEAITTAFSTAADLRVLWGGDESVLALRRLPSGPLCHDVSFPDRSSFSVISVAGWHAADTMARASIAEALVNDLFWFDSAACSSPRVVFWVGDPQAAALARREFVDLVERARSLRAWPVDAAMTMRRHVLAYALAASGGVTRIIDSGPATTHLELRSNASAQREWLGAGAICHADLERLGDLVPLIERKDQTLTHFGFDRADLVVLVHELGGRGIDRIVPIGQALAFSSVWDGFDLIDEFTRLVTVQT